MKSLTECIGIFIVEQLREPVGIFWSFVAPIAYLVLSSVKDGELALGADEYVQKAAWCLAYLALVTASTGFGLYLIGRRESGFIRSFLWDPSKRLRFVLAQYLASLALALSYGTAFVAITAATITDVGIAPAVFLLGKFAVTAALFMFAAAIFAALPITFSTASAVLSIAITIIVVAGFSSKIFLTYGHSYLAYVNPFFTAAHFMAASIPQPYAANVLGGQLVFLGLLGAYGIARLRVNPEWSNR
ncbi:MULTISPECIES: hypothetical protein [unclassified Achromobacter]|uniref:hypothetical protein n=1 Tax=unclassified Achromobacter TaxID=2626865 RepID=UPI000B51D8B2|nr:MULTISPECIES: hypothetical protein [unclassified Achromobacter]OWT74550.1 hypothetical protein CEY05_18265 [Achromobacter sp. HZ34]OWT79017.1 hypothetical protein CEY04_08185 [Achromobacter sp. HZ28]